MREDTHTITVGHLYTSLETSPLLPTMFEGYGWEYLYLNQNYNLSVIREEMLQEINMPIVKRISLWLVLLNILQFNTQLLLVKACKYIATIEDIYKNICNLENSVWFNKQLQGSRYVETLLIRIIDQMRIKFLFLQTRQVSQFIINLFPSNLRIVINTTILLLILSITNIYKIKYQSLSKILPMPIVDSFSQQKLKSQYFNCHVKQSKNLCTISLKFQTQSFNIPIYINSKIHQISAGISTNFCNKYQLKQAEQVQQIQNFICYRLAQQIRRVIITQDQNEYKKKDSQWSNNLIDILACHLNFQQSRTKNKTDNKQTLYQNGENLVHSVTDQKRNIENISYFKNKVQQNKTFSINPVQIDNYNPKSNNCKKRILLRSTQKDKKSKKNILDCSINLLLQNSLYNRSKERLTRRKQNVISRQKQKLKTQTKECTFHPDISLSNQKYKKTGKNEFKSTKLFCNKAILRGENNVFQKLYSNASQLKSKKNFFRVKTEEAMNYQQNKQLTFTPKINQCSKQIIKMKKQAYLPFEQTFNDKQGQNWKEKTSTTCTDTQKFSQNDRKDKSGPLGQLAQNCSGSSKNINVFEKLFKKESKTANNRQKDKKWQKQNCVYSFRPQLSKGTKKLLKQKHFPTLKQRVAIKEHKFQKNNSKSSLMSIQKYLSQLQVKADQDNFANVIIDDTDNIDGHQSAESGLHHNYSLSSIVLIDDSIKKLQSQTPKKGQNCPKSNHQQLKKSQKLFNSRKNKIFHEIFVRLTQKGGNTENVELTHKMIFNYGFFPQAVRSIFTKIGQQMQRMNVGLDQDEFIWSLSNTYEHLSLTEKGMLLGWGVKQVQNRLQS